MALNKGAMQYSIGKCDWWQIKEVWSKGCASTPQELLCHLIQRIPSKACASAGLDLLSRMSHVYFIFFYC
ncbi:hypothetical protein EJB05_31259 [Eragrostis curvula]|uniref:Uncharacterized protein n=1 Tax=Eragrostis curvula TaxID=38414 RepID=A0A5J9U4R5_9POAL|nr:hypothetical protein EJB05_34813 [Eragrostis curvula]TVU21610.1 hypothetical protein EJB05_31259 [Eragrostis curvula]